LRLVAGLERPDAGTLHVGDRDVTHAAPHLRGCAMVFQSYALWKHHSP
jgi:ABC-type sugar transport system ATPase subunit